MNMNPTSFPLPQLPPYNITGPPKHTGTFLIPLNACKILIEENASSCAICAYLAIARYTGKDGKYSCVGHYTIKERLGIGQRQVEEATDWLVAHKLIVKGLDYYLTQHDIDGIHRNNHDSYHWYLETFKDPPQGIWFDNKLVGKRGDKFRPLNILNKMTHHDEAARLLIFLNRHYWADSLCVNPKECYMKFTVIKESAKDVTEKFDSDFKIIQAKQLPCIYAKNNVKFESSHDKAMIALEQNGFLFRRIVVIEKAQGKKARNILYELDVKNMGSHIPRDNFMLAEDIEEVVSIHGFGTARVGRGGKRRFFNKYAAIAPSHIEIEIITVFDLNYFGNPPGFSSDYKREKRAIVGRNYIKEFSEPKVTF